MCFSLPWFQSILIWFVLVGMTIAVLRLLLPYVMTKMGWGAGEGFNLIMQVVRIVITAIIVIFVIIVVFAIIECAWSSFGGVGLFPHR